MSTPAKMVEQTVEYEDKNQDKAWAKIKKNPMVPIGVVGMFGMVAHGAWNYKNRGTMSTSVYLMHLRVRAQSMVVGALTIGIAYSLIKEYIWDKKT